VPDPAGPGCPARRLRRAGTASSATASSAAHGDGHDAERGCGPQSRRGGPAVAADRAGLPAKSATRLEGADFFQLFDQEKTVLGDTLVDREELVLTPGGRQMLSAELPADIRYIGVAASFRDIDNAVWRRAVAVEPNRTNRIDADFGSRGITLKVEARKVDAGTADPKRGAE